MIPKPLADHVVSRVVIDTNVLLDLFVFDDVRWRLLLDALENGDVHAYTRADCTREWELVLDYTHLPLDDAGRAAAQRRFAGLIRAWEGETLATPLPVCKDRDDQKFLELARDSGAEALITKDKALLKLAKQTRKRGLFRIVSPDRWPLDADL